MTDLRRVRSKKEAEADRIDMELYRLLGAAEEFLDPTRIVLDRHQKNWFELCAAIRAARTYVRREMCETDQKATK